MNYKKAFLFLAFVVMAANQVQAESPKTTTLPSIIVTAESESNADGYKANYSRSSTRTDTPLLDTPQSVSVVTQEQIRDQNISNMEEAARYIPGISVQQGESNRDQVTIRGNSTTADFFIDGARDDVQYFRDFYNIEQIEFLKGPNAMAFGRGGSGGVINRVSKTADGSRKRQIILSGGSFDNRRIQADVGDKVNDKLSLRLNSMYEKSGTFRQYGDLERFGFNPNATIKLGKNTKINVGYEYFSDKRFNDRGIPSSNGGVYKTSSSTFFGNPNENEANTEAHSLYSTVTHDFDNSLQIRNHTRYSNTDKFYQNVYVSKSIDSTGNLGAYNSSLNRENFTNQTDLTKKFKTGSLNHVALLGSEISNQHSRSLRNTGYFNNSSTSDSVSASSPLSFTPITYRQSSTDINGTSDVNVYALYVQDQIEINKHLQLIGGLRYDRFSMSFYNNRDGGNYKRFDNLISPRLGVVVKPKDSLSIYGSYSTSYLPSSGDQFSSLSTQTAILKPEKLQNYEIGTKWDVSPRLNLSASIYQLDRTNTRANDPNNVGYFLLTGESRTRGLELEATGKITDKWQLIAGYAFQDAVILSATSSASAGKKAALVPHNKGSLWNKYDITSKFSAAIGVVSQSDQFAAIDNAVKLKGFTRFDGALYYKINSDHKLQVNVENIFGRDYIQTAHNNNNIQPGSPRAFKVSLIADF